MLLIILVILVIILVMSLYLSNETFGLFSIDFSKTSGTERPLSANIYVWS